jgi:integrase
MTLHSPGDGLVASLRSRTRGKKPRNRVFDIPADLIRRFHADRKRAAIASEDDRGRRVDLHSLRLTFGTLLAKSGVPLTVAQRLMRHSDPKLTSNIYTDVRVLDLRGAVESIPSVVASDAPSDAPNPVNNEQPSGPPVIYRRKRPAS